MELPMVVWMAYYLAGKWETHSVALKACHLVALLGVHWVAWKDKHSAALKETMTVGC